MLAKQLVYNYPYEIFDQISCYLTNRQKGVCRTVCQSWRVLFTPSQYRDIKIRGDRQFSQFLQSILSGVGHYVKRLSIDDVYMTAAQLESLPYLCPNLVALSFNGRLLNCKSSTQNKTTLDALFSQWKYLRRLTELQDLTVTSHLLNTSYSKFSSLTHLNIRLNMNNTGMKTDFFASLSKANDLQNLSLDSISLSIYEMDTIHKSCPRLQKFRLTNSNLESIGNDINEKRNCFESNHWGLAKYMRSFEFLNGTGLYESYEWIDYIAAKYPNLTHIQLWSTYSVNTPYPEALHAEDDLRERYQAIAKIGRNCHSLKSVNFMNVAMNHWFFDEMDYAGTRLESIALGDMTDNTIDLLQSLIRSEQNVSSLTLWGWTSLCIQETMQETIAMVGQCSNRLTSFTISMQFSGVKNAPIPLDYLLIKCPKLKYLKFDNIQATLMFSRNTPEDDIASRALNSQLQHLVFENGSFRNEMFRFLSFHCFNLKKLEIDSSSLIGEFHADNNIKIHMPHHTFEYISINHARPQSQCYFVKQVNDIRLFDILLSKETHCNGMYELKDYEKYSPSLTFDYEQKPLECSRPTKFINHKNTPVIDKPVGPSVSIQCHSLANLEIGKFWVI